MKKSEDQTDKEAYNITSNALDGVTTTLISTLLTVFIVGENLLNYHNDSSYPIAPTFAVSILGLHYLSFVTAFYAQYFKVKHENAAEKLGNVTLIINIVVQIGVVALFGIVIGIITGRYND